MSPVVTVDDAESIFAEVGGMELVLLGVGGLLTLVIAAVFVVVLVRVRQPPAPTAAGEDAGAAGREQARP